MRVLIPVTRVDESFHALGSTVRIAAVAPGARGLLVRARDELRAFEACASRFRPDSELCALNADPRAVVPASARLREAVAAALWAADRSGGLVDPCLLDELEEAGYRHSFVAGAESRGSEAGRCGSSAVAGGAAPAACSPGVARPARPHPAARWRDVRVDHGRGTIARPPGLRLDLGGSGKGHAADLVARLLSPAAEWVVDAGGDVRVGGSHPLLVAHPLGGEPAARLQLADGAAATSSVVRRAWRSAGGGHAHHLLDPASGRPACTGLISVTALAPTTLEAETLAKAALLSGPDGARRILARRGGVAVHAGGGVEEIGPLPVLATAGSRAA
jgi:FAD:protein FMN transferase